MASVSIVVRALNEERHIGRLLEGVRAQETTHDYEVVLIDSGSKDATVGIAQAYGARVVHIAPERFTFGRSLNIGCEAATGEFLVFASAHVFPVYRDWLDLMVEPFRDGDVALVYGRQVGTAVSHFSEQEIFKAWFPGHSNPRQLHPFANNANAAIRRALWMQRPYDEELTGLEDLDWAKWALESGYHLSYQAGAEVVHVHEESSAQTLHRYEREAMALKRIFPDERMSVLEMQRLLAMSVYSDLSSAAKQGLLLREAYRIVRFRTLQFLGAYRGLNRPPQLTADLRRTFYYPPAHVEQPQTHRDASAIPYASGGRPGRGHAGPDGASPDTRGSSSR